MFEQVKKTTADCVRMEIERQYDVKIINQTARINFPFPHPDVQIWHVLGETEAIRLQIRSTLRQKLNAIDWQYSKADDGNRGFAYVAPMHIVPIPDVAYHATRWISVPTILKDGLLPGTPNISATGRPDCYGNIYVCLELGECPGSSVTEPRKATAMWWKWKLARKNRFSDSNWTIVAVRLEALPARIYRDIWSTSGLIIDNVERIAPERLAIVDDIA